MGDSSGDLDGGRDKASLNWFAGVDGLWPAAIDHGASQCLGCSGKLLVIGSKGVLSEDFLFEIENN